MDDKIKFVKYSTPKYYHTNVFLDNTNFVNNIYELFKNDIMFSPKTTSEMICIALYYLGKDDYDKMIDYYMMAIKLGDDIAALFLGNFYDDDSGDGKAVYYYEMAIAKGNNEAMYKLGNYYCNNHKKMLKYYLMAIDNGNVMAMHKLGSHYESKGNYDEMLKYYFMGANNGCKASICSLGDYYRRIKNYDEMLKYYLMIVDFGDGYIMYKLGRYYGKIQNYKKMKMYFMMAINLNVEVVKNTISKFYFNKFLILEFIINSGDLNYEIIDEMEEIAKLSMDDKQKDMFYMLLSNLTLKTYGYCVMSKRLELLLHFANKK